MYTLQDLRDDVRSYAGRSPHHFIEIANDVQLDKWINKKRMEWAEKSHCFYEEASPFTTKANTSIYDLQDLTAFAHSFIEITQFTVNGVVLRDLGGREGPLTQAQMFNLTQSHQTDAADTPARWSFHPPRSIRVWPTADEDGVTNTFVSGYVYPPLLEGDNADVLLADGDMDAHAKWIAGSVINPARDQEDAQLAAWLTSFGEMYIQAKTEQYTRRHARNMAMGKGRRSGASLR